MGITNKNRTDVLKEKIMFKKISKACFIALFVAACAFLSGCGRESQLEDAAVPVVNKIARNLLGGDAASCESVEITEKIGDKRYRANAHMDNGKTVKVLIEDRDDEIWVELDI